jgi:hypothetical protein
VGQPGGAYAAFIPAQHPRDSHGRFRDKWGLSAAAQKLISGIVGAFKPMTGSSDEDLQAKLDVHAGKKKRDGKAKAALDRFTSNGFAPVQADLRAGKANADAKEMDSLMEPLPEDMVLTRVMGPEAFGLPPGRIAEVEEWTGKLVADKGFAPTNVGTPFAVGGPHITVSILAPKGTRAIIPGGSREVILDRDQPLRIVKVHSDGAGGMYVYAVAQPKGARTRALGRGMRASEKAPAIEPTPEELKKRGLPEAGAPNASGPAGAPNAPNAPEAPLGKEKAPQVGAGPAEPVPQGNVPQSPAPEVHQREADVAKREADVAKREAEIAKLREHPARGVAKVVPKKAEPKKSEPAKEPGQHRAPSAAPNPVLEERRKQREAARAEHQRIAQGHVVAEAVAEVAELKNKNASSKVIASHIRAIANGPKMDEVRGPEGAAIRSNLERAAFEIENGDEGLGHRRLDRLVRAHGVLIRHAGPAAPVAFDPDKHDAVGPGLKPGDMAHVIRPGAEIKGPDGKNIELFKAQVGVPAPKKVMPPAPKAPEAPKDFKKMLVPDLRALAKQRGIRVLARDRKAEIIAKLELDEVRRGVRKLPSASRLHPAAKHVNDLIKNGEVPSKGDLQAMQPADLRSLAQGHGILVRDDFGNIPLNQVIDNLHLKLVAKENLKSIDSPRSRHLQTHELLRMNLGELRKLAEDVGIAEPHDLDKKDLLRALAGRRIATIPANAGGFRKLNMRQLEALAEENNVFLGARLAKGELIRRMIAAGVPDPEAPLENKSFRELKKQAIAAGLHIPQNATKQDLVALLEAPPQTEFHVKVSDRVKKLIASVASGIKKNNKIGDGAMGETSKVELNDGAEAIRKAHHVAFGVPPRRQADAEQLASVLAEAIGAPTPRVYRQDARTIFMEFISGKVAKRETNDRRDAAVASPEGKLIGLVDALTGNPDRHAGNWMIRPNGKPVGIDHGLAWSIEYNKKTGDKPPVGRDGEILPLGGGRSPFASIFQFAGRWRDEIQYSRSDLEKIRAKIEAQREQFKMLHREDWLDVSLQRLDAIIKRAKLP